MFTCARLGPYMARTARLVNHGHHRAASLTPSRATNAALLVRSPGQNRHFSVVPAVEGAILNAQHLITELHVVTGTPWYLTVPLVALSVNLVARLPLSIYTRRVAQRRAKLAPLIQVAGVRCVTAAFVKFPTSRQAATSEASRGTAKVAKGIYKSFGVQNWKSYLSVAVMPVWLTSIEAIRRLCGGPRGALGSLIFGPVKAPDPDAGAAAPSAACPAPADTIPTDAVSATGALGDAQDAGASQLLSSLTPGSDPSLMTGGCLWFPDLMVPDPLHILPFVLSAALALNILPRNKAGLRAMFSTSSSAGQGAPVSLDVGLTFQRRLRNAMLGVALIIGPATMDLPAALHLYWISSATITLIQTELVARCLKAPQVRIQPAKGLDTFIPLPRR